VLLKQLPNQPPQAAVLSFVIPISPKFIMEQKVLAQMPMLRHLASRLPRQRLRRKKLQNLHIAMPR
jgi:hypothetical protein